MTFSYFDRIGTVRGDSNGIGDFPMEYLRDHSGLPMGDESMVGTNSQSKNEVYLLLDAALYRDPTDPLAFSYPADHPLAAELEEQMTALLRLYTCNGEYLSPQAPKTQGRTTTPARWRRCSVWGRRRGRWARSCCSDSETIHNSERAMTPEAIAMLQFLLDIHAHRCVEQKLTAIQQCTITYTELCNGAWVPHLVRNTSPFLLEVAQWCQARNLPPINSLVVLADERVPGDAYNDAPGCSLGNWATEVQDCIANRQYPATV